MQQSDKTRPDPYLGQRTAPGPVHAPVYPVETSIDLTSNDAYLNGPPIEELGRLRRLAPVFWHPESKPHEPGFWVLTRPDDIKAVSQNPEVYSSAIGAGALISFDTSGWDIPQESLTIYRANMVHMDPPEHRDYRSLIMPYLAGPAAKRLEPVVQEKIAQLVAAIQPGEVFDLVSEFSAVTPSLTLCHLLGVPLADREQIIAWGDILAGAGDPEFAAAASGIHAKIYEYGWHLLNRKKAEPGNDLMSAAIRAYSSIDAKLRPGSMEGLFSLMVVAGHRTTRNTTTSGLLALYDHPDQLEALRAEPSLINNAVEEILRFTTVVPLFRRTCTRDTEIHGQKIARGEKVVMCYTAANRDEELFSEPDTLNIRRDNARAQLAFGWGEHMCAGNMLARLQLRTAIDAFVARFSRLEVVEPPEYLRTNQAISVKRVLVRVSE